MNVIPLSQTLIPEVEALLGLDEPYVRLRTSSDYWLYATLFSSTCPVALLDDRVAGVAIAFRSQDDPDDVNVQDVMTHPSHRQRGVARAALDAISYKAADWGCRRLYLTSEADNSAAHRTWLMLGFENVQGDSTDDAVSVVADFKGPGKHRAVYQRLLK